MYEPNLINTMKQSLELTLKDGIEPVEVQQKLNKYRHLKAFAINPNKIRVWFNSSHLTAKKVLKIIASTTNPDHRSKRRNVVSILEINEDAA